MSNNTNENNTYDNFESGELYLSIAKSEYENEHTRTQVIDTKISITLATVTAYFLLIPQFINPRDIMYTQVNTVLEALLPTLQIIWMVLSLVMALLSIIWLMRIINTHTYKVIDTKEFSDPECIKEQKGMYAAAIASYYVKATNYNSSVNDRRIPIYQHAIIFAVISICLFVLYIILGR